MTLPIVKDESVLATLNLQKMVQDDQKIMNIALICSHPHLFGFKTMKLEPDLDEYLLEFKATMTGVINVKFLIRYEVAIKEGEQM